MAFGIKRKELNRYKQAIKDGKIGILTHYWYDSRFPEIKTVTKVGMKDLLQLKSWGSLNELHDFMIDKKSTQIPHYDVFGTRQIQLLKSLKKWNMLQRFHRLSNQELEDYAMSITLKNDYLTVEAKPQGAELISIKDNETHIEYLWNGDGKYWGRHAPVLFPIVGRLKNDSYQLDGQTYHMSQHGFARDLFFDVVQQSDCSVSFRIESSAETRKLYPFDFSLTIEYTLEKNTIRTNYIVENGANKIMPFSLGAHPAFNIPLVEGTTFEDYYLRFSPRKTRTSIPLEGAYIDLKNRTLAQTNAAINLKRSLFRNDALILETHGENIFSIQSDVTNHGIDVRFKDFPYTGIWSPYEAEAPFVCIEPWFGIADSVDSKGDFLDKLGLQKLGPNDTFETHFDITVY